MVKRFLVLLIALTLGPTPQSIGQSTTRGPSAEIKNDVIGLPIRSSDGQYIGIVTHTGVAEGESLLIAEVERPLGLGSDLLAIPNNMYVKKGDFIELTKTAAYVRAKLNRNRRK